MPDSQLTCTSITTQVMITTATSSLKQDIDLIEVFDNFSDDEKKKCSKI